jgi:hypothetical protein
VGAWKARGPFLSLAVWVFGFGLRPLAAIRVTGVMLFACFLVPALWLQVEGVSHGAGRGRVPGRLRSASRGLPGRSLPGLLAFCSVLGSLLLSLVSLCSALCSG